MKLRRDEVKMFENDDANIIKKKRGGFETTDLFLMSMRQNREAGELAEKYGYHRECKIF